MDFVILKKVVWSNFCSFWIFRNNLIKIIFLTFLNLVLKMSLINIIEQSIKNLNSLPASVQKNMSEIRKLDITCQKMNIKAQTKLRELITSWKTITKENRKKSYELLRVNLLLILFNFNNC